jgi:hypothetical protein
LKQFIHTFFQISAYPRFFFRILGRFLTELRHKASFSLFDFRRRPFFTGPKKA